jgi:5-methyltetrahydrofolate--homocysteine methyltransferase
LEPALAGQAVDQRGTIVLATVRGDVHDIGKNLVDIILANNGYRVINLGTKQPIEAIIEAAQAHQADAIGLSGLLVKSTQVMREDLEELNRRGLSSRFPVILGGAALTRDFVEGQLADIYQGDVYYANDAFAGLSLMAAIIGGQGVRRNSTRVEQASSKANPAVPVNSAAQGKRSSGKRSGECGASAALVANASPVMPPTVGDAPVPTPPFWGVRQAKPALSDILDHLDRDQLFRGQWGLTLAKPGSSQAEAAQERLAGWLAKAQQGDWADCAVSWAYWPCQSNGDNLEVFATDPTSADDWRQDEPWVIPLPRQSAGQRLCLADYFRDRRKTERLGPDVLAAQVVTVGPIWSQVGADLLAADRYRDYFELHGLSVALAEALADYWHDQIRRQLDLARINADWLTLKTPTPYGQRYSFGYPALPDLEPRSVLVDWLQADRLGVELTDGWQLTPEQSTDALIVHHPLARYFSVR